MAEKFPIDLKQFKKLTLDPTKPTLAVPMISCPRSGSSWFFFEDSDKFLPIAFDEAGHCVPTQYILTTLEGSLPAEHLHYLETNSKLLGRPELGLTPGVKFSLGPMINGIACDKALFCLGSDGSQQEGNNTEAAT